MSDNLLRVNPAATERKTADERREADPRRGGDRVRRARLRRRVTDAIARARGHLAALRVPAVRHEEGAVPRRPSAAASARRSRPSSGPPRGSAGEEALDAMGRRTPSSSPTAPAARRRCRPTRRAATPTIREVVRAASAGSSSYVERVADVPPEESREFFARGMLLNVVASMGLQTARSRGRSGCSTAAASDGPFFRLK